MSSPVVSGSFEERLAEYGVTPATLTRVEKTALDEQGYLVLADVMDGGWLEALRAAFEELAQKERASAGREGGTRHIPSLDLAPDVFQRILTHPRFLAAAWHVLQCPLRSSGIDGRDPLPGHGLQGIHRDAPPRAPGDPFTIVNSLWLLDDYTADNGATRVVPGSHLITGKPAKTVGDPGKSYPGEAIVLAKAGSVLLFNGHTLHGGTRNQSTRSRRVLRCDYGPRNRGTPFGYEEKVIDRSLPPMVRYLLGESG